MERRGQRYTQARRKQVYPVIVKIISSSFKRRNLTEFDVISDAYAECFPYFQLHWALILIISKTSFCFLSVLAVQACVIMVILQCLQHFSVNCTVYFSLTLILDLHMTFFCGFLCLIQDAVERKCVIGRKMHCRRCHFTQPLHKLYIGIWVSVLFPFSGTSKELTFIMKIIMKNGEHCFHVDKVYKLTF